MIGLASISRFDWLNFKCFLISLLIGPFVAFSALIWNVETILIMLGLLIIIAVSFFREEIGLYLVILLMPIGENFIGINMHYQWVKATDIFPLCPFVIIISMTGLLLRKTAGLVEVSFTSSVNFIIISFLGWAWGSILWSPSIYHTLVQFAILISNVVLFYLLVATIQRSEKTLRKMVKVFICCAVVFAAISIISLYFLKKDHKGVYPLSQKITLDYAIKHSDFRAKALATPNNTACLLNVAIAFSMCILHSLVDRRRRALVVLIIIFLVYCVLETKSKAGVGSLIFLGMFSIAAYRHLRKRFIKTAIVYFGIIFSLFIVQSMGEYRESRILKTQEMSFQAHLEIWEVSLREFKERAPGWGLGIGGLRYYRDPLPHGHSIYFSIFYDFGVIGSLLQIGLILTLIVKIVKLFLMTPYQNTYSQLMLIGSAGSLLVVGVHGLVDFCYLDFTLWFVLGIVVGTILLIEKKELILSSPTVFQ